MQNFQLQPSSNPDTEAGAPARGDIWFDLEAADDEGRQWSAGQSGLDDEIIDFGIWLEPGRIHHGATEPGAGARSRRRGLLDRKGTLQRLGSAGLRALRRAEASGSESFTT